MRVTATYTGRDPNQAGHSIAEEARELKPKANRDGASLSRWRAPLRERFRRPSGAADARDRVGEPERARSVAGLSGRAHRVVGATA